jgi:hypothetical protein
MDANEAPKQLTEGQQAAIQAETHAAFTRMTANARRELKKMSKNELVRTVIAQLIEKHQLQQALAEANEALEATTPVVKSEVSNA